MGVFGNMRVDQWKIEQATQHVQKCLEIENEGPAIGERLLVVAKG